MVSTDQITRLSEQMTFEPDGELPLAKPPVCTIASPKPAGVIYSAAAGNQRVKLLKTLLSSVCERDCYYCPFRSGRDFHRETLKPDELSAAFISMHRANAVEGLFLSSGIAAGGMKTQDRLIDAAELLRNKYQFRGYLHLKIMPGAERDQVLRAMQLADRISINLEAPNEIRLANLAPHKVFWDELLAPLRWAEEIRQSLPSHQGWSGYWPSLTTQFVVGAVGESDLELLSASKYLFNQLRLSRIYYSAFSPVLDTPLENHSPENPVRQLRLYQASFLLRDYGFDLEDFPFNTSGNLPLSDDPKRAWAQQNLIVQPLEVNRAERWQLLRVPGIGPKSADALINARRKGPIRQIEDLQRLGIAWQKAAPYILLEGRKPSYQPSLW